MTFLIPVVVSSVAVVFGGLLAAGEGWSFSDGFLYVIRDTLSMNISLTDAAPFVRVNALFAANFFKSVLYHPDESQLLTCGTDRKITYWDVLNMNAIRIIDGSETATYTAAGNLTLPRSTRALSSSTSAAT